jgi:hypothetical protein
MVPISTKPGFFILLLHLFIGGSGVSDAAGCRRCLDEKAAYWNTSFSLGLFHPTFGGVLAVAAG